LREIERGGLTAWAIAALSAIAFLAPSGAEAQSQLVWENEYEALALPTPVTIGGTTVSISGLDPFGIGNATNFRVNYAQRGAHTGYYELGIDATARDQFTTVSLGFSQQVEALSFSLLDVDTNNQFHDSITVVGWGGGTPFAPTTVSIGASVAEVGPGVYSGLGNVPNGSAASDVLIRFDQLTDSVTFVQSAGPRASANPALQVAGISDLTWSLPCLSTVTVSTTAELRAATANSCVLLILMTPGLYDLTVSGSDELDIDQDKILRNAGGGEVIIDAAGASRVMNLRAGNVIELDGLTITGGNENNGAGIETRADLTIRNSTITGNNGRDGGGLRHRSGPLLMENVTVSGNTATNDGGGLELRDGARLVHVTITNNSADRGGGLRSRDNEVSLANTIVAGNLQNSGGEIRGTITSEGINLVEGGCNGCGPLDLTGDPSLLPLASNGGNSRTHALGPGSIALDAGSALFGLPTDQRGVGRPAGPGFDLGAYEAPLSIGVIVTAASAAVDRLPSNTTAYGADFTITNTGPAPSDYILTATSTGAAVTIDSIRGPGMTSGTPADSARTAILSPLGGSVVATVFYTVLDVAAGATDPIVLTATSGVVPLIADFDTTTVTVVRPFLGLTKLASVPGDTIPGAAVTYQMTVTNLGTESATQVEVVDSLPTEVDYVIGSTSETLPAGITATLEFDDGSDSWSYAPMSAGCGAGAGSDRCVRAIRWTLDTPLPATAPSNAVVFQFTAGIR
jgi:uncharacterized repeat protein (TIGR01451 family)